MLDRSPSSNLTTPWTPERIELMKKLWLDGLSASEVAAKLGKGATRNSVIGKLKRLKIERSPAINTRNKTAAMNRPKTYRTKAAVNHDHRVRSSMLAERRRTAGPEDRAIAHRMATRENLHAEEAIDPGVDVTHLLGLMELRHDTCRFPIGDPRSPAFGFCGQPPASGKPYCSKHCHDAYQRD